MKNMMMRTLLPFLLVTFCTPLGAAELPPLGVLHQNGMDMRSPRLGAP